MIYVDYIQESLAKGTIGSYISLGILGFIALSTISGLIFGLTRGFSKTVIRLFTIILSAMGALVGTTATANVIVNFTNAPDVTSLKDLIVKHLPSAASAIPEKLMPLLEEMSAETSTVFLMMVVCLFVSPIIFITYFYILKGLTFLVYKLLSGLVGAISYGKSKLSTIAGGMVGVAQGIIISAIVLIPFSGVLGIMQEARTTLIDTDDPDNQIVEMYDSVIDDIIDNPALEAVNKYGGTLAFGKLTTVTVSGKSYDMSQESIGVLHLFADAAPLIGGDYNWMDPTPDQLQAYYDFVEHVGDNDLIAAFGSDVMRGCAKCIEKSDMDIASDGANNQLLKDVINMFATTTSDTIEGDLKTVVDIYQIMCDNNLLVAFNDADTDILRNLLTNKNADDKTVIEVIIDRLNSYERSKPIVRSFTKISLSLMHDSMGVGGDTTELYESVKENMHDVLAHNKDDFETEEEYKAAVGADLDAALAENNLSVDEQTKQNMIDYIADNFGDKTDITDEDIDDAILSYYASYAASQGK